jgi:hypothetical protein
MDRSIDHVVVVPLSGEPDLAVTVLDIDDAVHHPVIAKAEHDNLPNLETFQRDSAADHNIACLVKWTHAHPTDDRRPDPQKATVEVEDQDGKTGNKQP